MNRAAGWFALTWLVALVVSVPARAQTSRPAAAPPAAVSAYDHEALRATGSTSFLGAGKTQNSDSSTNALDFRRVAISLAIVLGLIFAVRWASRWMFPGAAVGRSSQVIKVLSRSVVAPKQQFLLVQLGKRLVLVADSGANMSALTEITDPDEVASLLGQLHADRPEPERASAFGPLLGKASRQFEDVPPVEDATDDEAEAESAGDLTDLSEKIRLLKQQLGGVRTDG